MLAGNFRKSVRSTLAKRLLCTTALMVLPAIAQANPKDGQVVAGSATITQSGQKLTVTQTGPNAVIDWQGFSINTGETTVFSQPGASAISLNRVIGADPSVIMGNLTANGQVWLVNPNGIAFGKSARVDVAGLLATTIDIADPDFMGGRYRFNGLGNPGAMVTNAGRLTLRNAGLAALVAPGVENSGVIRANLGQIQLSSAAAFTVDLYGDGLFNFTLDKQVTQAIAKPNGAQPSAAVSNTGGLIAPGGHILLTANAASSVVSHAINMSGYAQATSASVTASGDIELDGGSEGTVEVSGNLNASGQRSGQNGGAIRVVGGATDGTVAVYGTLNASGSNAGEGGRIETSAAHVEVANSARITTAASHGNAGSWTIDPHDFTVAATGGDITGAALSTQLASNNVTIASSSGASGTNGDVNIDDVVGWKINTLTLTAANNINVGAVITATGNASLALNPATANSGNAAVSNGTVLMRMSSSGAFTGRVDFSSSGTLSISGTPYTVINSLGVAGDAGTATLQGVQNNLSGHYVLGRNIDATATSSWNSGAGFAPIGDVSDSFSGVLNGLGHSIDKLSITSNAAFVGLFSQIGPGGTVSNIGLTNANINGSSNNPNAVGSFSFGTLVAVNNGAIIDAYATGSVAGRGGFSDVGGLIAYNASGATVSQSYASVTITAPGGGYIGGLIGDNWGTVSLDHASGSVTAVGAVGGLVGDNAPGATISDSYATGSVNASGTLGVGGYGGGLVGSNIGTILRSYATGGVAVNDGPTNAAGGLVASNTGIISKSFANGAVSGGANNDVGGLVGINITSTLNGSPIYPDISQSYATGSVHGGTTSDVGGLVGYNGNDSNAVISQSYSVGAVNAVNANELGGLIGHNAGSAINSYWDTESSGQPTSQGGTGLLTAQLKATLPAGFDSGAWALNGTFNSGYPHLLQNVPPGSTPAPTPTPTPASNPLNNFLWLTSNPVVQFPADFTTSGSAPAYIPTPIVLPPNPAVVQSLLASIATQAPQLGQYISNSALRTATEDAIELALQSSDMTPRDIADFISGYFQSSGYRTLINNEASGVLTKDIAIGIVTDLTGSLAAWIAKHNGASDAVADFDKNLTGFIATGLITGPAAEAISAAVQIVDSGRQLTVSDFNNFNQEIVLAESVAQAADARAQVLLRNGDHVQAEVLLRIAANERSDIVAIRNAHPIIATLSEIPGVIGGIPGSIGNILGKL